MLANFGGTPTADWEQERERTLEPWRDPRRYSWTPPHQLFEGGTFRAILDGAEGPDFVAVSDLVFREGSDWAGVLFRAQDEEGDWQITYQSDKIVGPTVMGRAVGRPLVDDAGTASSYDFKDFRGRNWLESSGKTYETGEVYSRHAGPDVGFVYAVEDNRLQQGRRLVWFTPDEAEPFWSSEVVQGHELYGWVGSPSRPVFRVYSEGKHGLVYGRGTYAVFDELLPPAIQSGEPGGERLAHLAMYDGAVVLAVHHLDEESIPVQGLGGRLTGANPPELLPDGRVVFVAHLDTEPLPYFDYGRGEGGSSEVVIYDEGTWHLGGEADRIFSLCVSEGGRIAWVAVQGEERRVEVFDDGELTRGELFDKIDDLDFFGERLVYVAEGAGKRLVVDGTPGLEVDWLYGLGELPGGEATYGFGEGGKDFMMVADVPVGPFDSVSRGVHYANLELLVFTAHDEAYTSTELVVVSTRTGERGEVLFRERFDDLEEDYMNRDRDRLVHYAASAGRVERLVLDLVALRSGSGG